MASTEGPINIGVLSLVEDETIRQQLNSILKTPKTLLHFIRLSPRDLNSFKPPENLDAVILLHSCNDGRLSLMDVTDARYTTLLPTLHEHFGSRRICIIAYLSKVTEHTQYIHLEILRARQPTTFEMSDYVILCDKLENVFPSALQKLNAFMKTSWEETAQTPWDTGWNAKQRGTGTKVLADEQNISTQEITTERTRPAEHLNDVSEIAPTRYSWPCLQAPKDSAAHNQRLDFLMSQLNDHFKKAMEDDISGDVKKEMEKKVVAFQDLITILEDLESIGEHLLDNFEKRSNEYKQLGKEELIGQRKQIIRRASSILQSGLYRRWLETVLRWFVE